ncbi:response regulator transcription factor [Lysinibacillus sphaericus]|uniref:response regulator transcription factor n=1 Tax=Lysinibacillus sphaericus TaxID=1421 RepID=UPI002FBEB93E
MNYKIFAVVDDLKVQELIKQFLMTHNYYVEVVSDADEGIKRLKSQSYDLILLYIKMPKRYEVVKMFRSQFNIPIIFLTALEEELGKIKGFDLGINDYITKPFPFHVLIRRVQAVLRRSNNTNLENYLYFNQLQVDCKRIKVYVNKEEIQLTTKEFKILQLLLRNEKKVLTRNTIIQKVWDYEYSGETRKIDAHIKNIRKKLNIPYIKTVRGIGYKIDE